MSKIEIDEIMESFGFTRLVKCCYKESELNIYSRLRLVETNVDVMQMCKSKSPSRVIEMYLEHKSDNGDNDKLFESYTDKKKS